MIDFSGLEMYVMALATIALFLMVATAILVAATRLGSAREELVTRFVTCPQRQDAAVVTFVEHAGKRSVQSCSLLDVGERCSERCACRMEEVSAAAVTASAERCPPLA
jgi:hypothetical protein